MGLADTLAKTACGFEYEKFSSELIENTKLHVLDGIGVALHGSTLRPLFDPLIKILRRWGGDGVSSVFGEPDGFPSQEAAFLNSVINTASAYSETHRATLAHPYSPVLSTALAVGEEESLCGKDLLLAMVAGYEVFLRVASAVNPSLLQRGIQTTGAIAPFGAAAACGVLYRFDQTQMKDAISHAANFAGSSLIEAHGAKPYFAVQVGANVKKGILAALLAREGVVGCDTNLEGGTVHEKGFLQAFSDEYDVNSIEKGFGEKLGIQDTGFAFYLVASFSRTPIDATLSIVRDNRIGVADIESITVKLTNTLFNFTQRNIQTANQSAREAFYYIPFHLALVLLKGGVEHYMYTDENLRDPKIREVMKKVDVRSAPELDAEYSESKAVTASIVELRTKDGKIFSKKLSSWRGDAENPATKEELQAKFRRVTSKALSPEKAEEVIETVDRLESIENIRELGHLIRGF